MRHAISLAERARGKTSPNPMVGAVVVKDNQLIAEGWHEGPGLPHAEVAALDRAQERANGATLYVTLEPCCHWGRTGPCTERILSSGVRRVIAAAPDPNPNVGGKGFAQLREAGLTVHYGLCQREAVLLNRAYLTWITSDRPYVFAKAAQSLDGKVATQTGESKWITSEFARQDGHVLREEVDAIAVGIGTLLADNPRLTARLPKSNVRQPLRVVLDSRCRTPLSAQCLHSAGSTLIATTPSAEKRCREALAANGAELWIDEPSTDRVDPGRLLAHLATRGVTSLLIEGGPTVVGSFWDLDLIDEFRIYIAPRLLGGVGAPSSVGGLGLASLYEAPLLTDVQWSAVGRDIRFTGRVRRTHLDVQSCNDRED